MILVHLETTGGQIAAQGYELLDIARRLAADGGKPVVAAILGRLDAAASGVAADRVIRIDRPELAVYTPEAHGVALASLIAGLAPDVVLTAYSTMGMDLAPYVAARLGRPMIAPCTAVEAGPGAMIATASLHGGRILLRAEVAPGAILSFAPGAGSEAAGRQPGTPVMEVYGQDLRLDGLRSTVLGEVTPEPGDFDLTRSARIVCVGRGIGSADAIPDAQALAAALGADLAGSRPVIDAGWLSKVRQVGKSGVRVAPKLYVALGVSGAPEHLEGMARSDLIIAVNSDPAAPIFDVAHFGAVTDIFALMRELARLAVRQTP